MADNTVPTDTRPFRSLKNKSRLFKVRIKQIAVALPSHYHCPYEELTKWIAKSSPIAAACVFFIYLLVISTIAVFPYQRMDIR